MAIEGNKPPRQVLRWSPGGGGNSSATSSSSTDVADTWDYASGMDEAVKRADEMSGLAASKRAMLYGGDKAPDLGSVMAAADRIRALRQYLSAFGDVSEERPFPFAIPMERLANRRISGSSSSSTSQSGSGSPPSYEQVLEG